MAPVPEWNREALLQSPLFAPLHLALAGLDATAFPTLQDCNALLAARCPIITVQSGLPLRFVPQEYDTLPFERQYEPRCYLKGEVPTRADNWHDLLNALVWLTFPKAKAAINARHYHALTNRDAEPGGISGSQRGAVRDVNTLLDESGVIVVAADGELARLLRNFRWKELFWQRREQVKTGMSFYLFGHGLYEKALQPYIGMTGQGLLLAVGQEFFGWPLAQRLAHLDTLLANHLAAPEHCRSTRDLSPVPLLGVPGWAAGNNDAAYYDNTAYFRPGRRG
ncbi:MAG: DUF3025 domain-containing protein [Nitrosomonadales bacterium]|nr:DUF3025 domain-containing protein [Nitrosomonadales bacterium]